MKKFFKVLPLCLMAICLSLTMFACSKAESIKFMITDYTIVTTSPSIIRADNTHLTQDVNLPNGIETIKVFAFFENNNKNVTVTPEDFHVVKNGTKYYGKYFVTGFEPLNNGTVDILVTYSYKFISSNDSTFQAIDIAFGESQTNLEPVATNHSSYKLYYKNTEVETSNFIQV